MVGRGDEVGANVGGIIIVYKQISLGESELTNFWFVPTAPHHGTAVDHC
jgi:hypothetical protein